MADLDLLDPTSSSPSRATDLIADFQARRDAWRRQGENLARLKADARAAASREAAAILDAARTDIHHIVADARRALLALNDQMQAISGAEAEGERSDDESESVLQAQRELQRLLESVGPDLEELSARTRQFDEEPAPAPAVSAPLAAPPVEEPEVDEVENEAAVAAIAKLFEHVETASAAVPEPAAAPSFAPMIAPKLSSIADPDLVHAPIPVHLPDPPDVPPFVPPSLPPADRDASRRGKAGIITGLALVIVTVVGAGGLWLSGYLDALGSVVPPLASVPPAPRVPGPGEKAIPTLSASLVALPPSTPLSLDLEVRREAWMESTIDSGAPTARVLRAGETMRLQGAKGISISVRDAGAVVVSVNGGARAPLGADGQGVTKQYIASDREIASQ